MEGDPAQAVPEEVSMVLFQEAALNAQWYATAHHFEVTLRFVPEQVELVVEGDGCGFAVPRHLSQLVAANHTHPTWLW